MKKSIVSTAVISLLAVAIAGTPALAPAQTAAGGDPAAKKTEMPGTGKKRAVIPFHGKVAALDKSAKTFKVGERTFTLTSESRMTKNGKPATFEEAVVGDEVGGSYQAGEGDKLEVQTVRFGPKPEGEAGGEGKTKSKAETKKTKSMKE